MGAEVALFSESKEVEQLLETLQKKVAATKDGSKTFGGIVNAVVFADIIRHFEQEQGSEGPWKPWSDRYSDYLETIGRSGNQILQFSGRLRKSFTPRESYRADPDGVLWFNPAKTKDGYPYAWAHDTGEARMPKRDFMWLSDSGMEGVEEQTMRWLLED
jgi:phage gpG-like protein